jgi:hypothetical protein
MLETAAFTGPMLDAGFWILDETRNDFLVYPRLKTGSSTSIQHRFA